LASSQLRHALAQLFDREKTFLISGEQTIDALADADDITPEPLFATFGRISLASCREPPLDLVLDEARIFEQPHNLGPNDFVQKVLTNRAVVANGAGKPPPGVGTETSIIVDRTCA